MRTFLTMLLVVSLLPYTAHAMSAGEPTDKPSGEAMIASDPPGKMVGGPCTYAEYPGKATIVSVKEAPPSSGYSKDKYEVKFSFTPKDKIKEPLVKLEGKTFMHTLLGGTPPGKTYLEKNGIKEGAVFDAILKVIKKGTCTPIVFDFPGIQ